MSQIECFDPRIVILKVKNTYSYLVIDDNDMSALVVDPAEELSAFEAALASLKPLAILLTHHHNDHVNMADELSKRYEIPTLMSVDEINFYNFKCTNLVPVYQGNLRIGSFAVEVLSTPGHTKGSVCYLIEDALFTGDTLFIEGCGACNLDPGGSPWELFKSIQLIKSKLKQSCRIFPGHSYGEYPGMIFDYLKKVNIYLNIDNEDDFIRFRMRENSNLFNFK